MVWEQTQTIQNDPHCYQVYPDAVDDEWEDRGEDDEAESKETKPAASFITFPFLERSSTISGVEHSSCSKVFQVEKVLIKVKD